MSRAQSRMLHCSVVGCNNKQANKSEVTYFSWSKDPQRQKSWLAEISRDKGNLLTNVFVCSSNLQNRIFYTDRPLKVDFNSYSKIFTISAISTPRKTSEIRAKQKGKQEVRP